MLSSITILVYDHSQLYSIGRMSHGLIIFTSVDIFRRGLFVFNSTAAMADDILFPR